MPGMSGREIAEQVTALRPGIRTLFISGQADDMLQRQGLDPKAPNLMRKPFTLDELTDRVRDVLDGP